MQIIGFVFGVARQSQDDTRRSDQNDRISGLQGVAEKEWSGRLDGNGVDDEKKKRQKNQGWRKILGRGLGTASKWSNSSGRGRTERPETQHEAGAMEECRLLVSAFVDVIRPRSGTEVTAAYFLV